MTPSSMRRGAQSGASLLAAFLLLSLPALADRPAFQGAWLVTGVTATGASWEVEGTFHDYSVLSYLATDCPTGALTACEDDAGNADVYRVTEITSNTETYLRAVITYAQSGAPSNPPAPGVFAMCAIAPGSTNVPLQPSESGSACSDHLLTQLRNFALAQILATSETGRVSTNDPVYRLALTNITDIAKTNAWSVERIGDHQLRLWINTNDLGGSTGPGTTNASGLNVDDFFPTNLTPANATVRAAIIDLDRVLGLKLDRTNLHTGAATTGAVTSTSADAAKFYRGDGTWQTIAEMYFAPLWRAFAAGSSVTNAALDIFRAAEGEPLITGAIVGEADKRFYLLRNGRHVWRDGSGSWGLHMTTDVANCTVTFEQESAAGPVTVRAADFAQVGVTGGVSPVGSIIMFAATNAPSGWLLCDGAAVSRSTYARLYAIVGDTWGAGNGTTTFNIPDLRERFPRGHSASTNLLGTAGGAASQTLTIAQLPSHNHTAYAYGQASGTHGHDLTSGGTEYFSGFPSSQSGRTTNVVSTVGSGSPVTNLPPFRVVNFIIKH